MGQEEPCVNGLVSEMGMVQRKEMPNVVGDEHPLEIGRTFEDICVIKPEQFLMVALD